MEKVAAMEAMLSEVHEYDELDRIIKNYVYANLDKINEMKKSVYMELAGKLIYRVSD